MIYIGRLINIPTHPIHEWEIKPVHIFSDSAITNVEYVDSTDIDTWANIGEYTYDYKFVRKQIQTLVFTKASMDLSGWNNLTQSEKEIAASWFTVPKYFRDLIYNVDEQIKLGAIFNDKSNQSRYDRFHFGMMQIYHRLTLVQSNQVLDDIENGDLRQKYIMYGREGTLEDGKVGLFDYVLSRVGTTYENTGLSTYDYIPVGYANMSDFCNYIMSIIRDGIY